MMGLPDGPKSIRIGLVVLIQYRLWQTPTHPASHVAVAITLNAKASSLKTAFSENKLNFRRNYDDNDENLRFSVDDAKTITKIKLPTKETLIDTDT